MHKGIILRQQLTERTAATLAAWSHNSPINCDVLGETIWPRAADNRAACRGQLLTRAESNSHIYAAGLDWRYTCFESHVHMSGQTHYACYWRIPLEGTPENSDHLHDVKDQHHGAPRGQYCWVHTEITAEEATAASSQMVRNASEWNSLWRCVFWCV